MENRIDVLDHGFVRLVDVMGDDPAIVQMARVSYQEGTKTIREDKGLINYLMANRHTSPFEGVVFKFHVKVPIFVMRQWIRHRTMSVNEVSARYSVLPDEFYIPEPERVLAQSIKNKQGSGETLPVELQQDFVTYTQNHGKESYEMYEKFLNHNVTRELSRINLPLNIYTEFYFVQNLHNLLHMINLRADPHAQYEIQVYANAIKELIKPHVPLAIDAFEEHMQYAVTFSRKEMEYIRKLAEERHIEQYDSPPLESLSKREWEKLKEKLHR